MLALSAVRCPDRDEIAGLMTTLAPVWNPLLAQALRHHFYLTAAETNVVQGLVTGQTLSQIAAARGRSVHTVRTQMKTILRKTDLDSQVELVRLVGFMERFGGNGHADSTGSANRPADEVDQHDAITLSTGRRMEYSLLGPADGRPVLFVHGMLDHAALTARARDYLFRNRIRLIAPARPSFGSSDPDPAGGNAPLRFAGYAEELLDALGIDRMPVIGHMAGSLNAIAIAAKLGPRISGVLNIAGGVPILSKEQFSVMAPRQRLIALTACHAPHLLPMFLKAGIALIRNGGENAFLNALYKGSPVDYAVARQPEIRVILNEGYNFAIAQGFRAFQIDAMQVTGDWSEWMEQVSCPVILVHGVHDPVVRIDSVREFARRYNNCTLVESTVSGQLVLSSEPALVLDQLQKLGDRHPSPS
jgi:pimeloyl-ACP methyl ester carboxylesterase/DNA-binding CsgD family transcriptional regulator